VAWPHFFAFKSTTGYMGEGALIPFMLAFHHQSHWSWGIYYYAAPQQ